MTNKHTHHSNQNIFQSQSHPAIVQHSSTQPLVQTVQRTVGLSSTWPTRIIPLDVEDIDISRNLARLPASPAERRPDTAPTHIHLVQQGRGNPLHNGQGVPLANPNSNSAFPSGTNTKRPAAQVHTQTAEGPGERGVRIDPDSAHSPQKLAERPLGGVRQDKDRNSCDRTASLQPAAVNKFTRSQATRRNSPRSQKDSVDNRRAVPVQVWVSPLVKDELSRIASSDGLSLSSAGAALLERGLQQNVDMQYGALLRPIIETAIARQMAGIATRLTWLLVRIAFDAGQTRSLVTNILGRQPGVTEPVLKTLLESSGRSAKGNIMRRTPHISELISAVEQWMVEDDGGEKEKQYD